LGYGFSEFKAATPVVKQNSLQLHATLAQESLQDIAQLALVPTTRATSGEAQSLSQSPEVKGPSEKVVQKQKQDATFAYYKGVARLIDNAAARVEKDPTNFPWLANTYDTVSKRIGEFPIQSVDPEVIKFGGSVASNCRAIAASYRGASLNVDALNDSITYEVNTNPNQSLYTQNYSQGYWGWGGVTTDPRAWQVKSNKEDVRQKQVQAVTAEQPKRQQLSLMMQDQRQQVRQMLNEKYSTDPEAK